MLVSARMPINQVRYKCSLDLSPNRKAAACGEAHMSISSLRQIARQATAWIPSAEKFVRETPIRHTAAVSPFTRAAVTKSDAICEGRSKVIVIESSRLLPFQGISKLPKRHKHALLALPFSGAPHYFPFHRKLRDPHIHLPQPAHRSRIQHLALDPIHKHFHR